MATPGDPRVLVLYGTSDGQTAKIARAMADTLRASGLSVDVHDAAANPPSAEGYDAVIVGASVNAGRYQKSVTQWVRANAAVLGRKRTAFVSVCLAVLAHTPQADREIEAKLVQWYGEVGWRPTEWKVVAGALPYTKYPWWKRYLMRRIVAKQHGDTDTSRDYEYTDWRDLEAFAAGFAAHVVVPAGVGLAS